MMELSGLKSAIGITDATRQSLGDTRSASISQENRQAFETAVEGQRQEGPKKESCHHAPSLETLPYELRTSILQEVMNAPPDAASQAEAFRSARNLTHASPDYLNLVAGHERPPATEFRQLASDTTPQRAQEAFRGYVNSLNESADRSERRQKINTIHDAAGKEYRNPDAQLYTLQAAFLADRTAESVDYHQNANIFTRVGRHPTADTAQRALDATRGGPNAAMMGTVLLSNLRVANRLQNSGRLRQVPQHMDNDPNFTFNQHVPVRQSIQPRDGVDPAWLESHAFRTTQPGDAVRDYEESPAHGDLSEDLD